MKEAKWYETNAVEIYQTAYNKNPSKSYKLLTRVLYEWGKRTVLELGVEGQSREFISVAGVQEHLSMIWRGNISLNESYQNVFLCMFLSPVLWFLPSVIIKFDESIPHYRRKQRAQGIRLTSNFESVL